MSTLVVTNLGVYTDEKVTVGVTSHYLPKIIVSRETDDLWGAFVGDTDMGSILLERFRTGAQYGVLVIPNFNTRNTEGIIVFNEEPHAVWFDKRTCTTTISPIQLPIASHEIPMRWFGSGRNYFPAYFAEHEHIHKAINLTVTHDPDSGGDIHFRGFKDQATIHLRDRATKKGVLHVSP